MLQSSRAQRLRVDQPAQLPVRSPVPRAPHGVEREPAQQRGVRRRGFRDVFLPSLPVALLRLAGEFQHFASAFDQHPHQALAPRVVLRVVLDRAPGEARPANPCRTRAFPRAFLLHRVPRTQAGRACLPETRPVLTDEALHVPLPQPVRCRRVALHPGLAVLVDRDPSGLVRAHACLEHPQREFRQPGLRADPPRVAQHLHVDVVEPLPQRVIEGRDPCLLARRRAQPALPVLQLDPQAVAQIERHTPAALADQPEQGSRSLVVEVQAQPAVDDPAPAAVRTCVEGRLQISLLQRLLRRPFDAVRPAREVLQVRPFAREQVPDHAPVFHCVRSGPTDPLQLFHPSSRAHFFLLPQDVVKHCARVAVVGLSILVGDLIRDRLHLRSVLHSNQLFLLLRLDDGEHSPLACSPGDDFVDHLVTVAVSHEEDHPSFRASFAQDLDEEVPPALLVPVVLHVVVRHDHSGRVDGVSVQVDHPVRYLPFLLAHAPLRPSPHPVVPETFRSLLEAKIPVRRQNPTGLARPLDQPKHPCVEHGRSVPPADPPSQFLAQIWLPQLRVEEPGSVRVRVLLPPSQP